MFKYSNCLHNNISVSENIPRSKIVLTEKTVCRYVICIKVTVSGNTGNFTFLEYLFLGCLF